MYTILVVEDEQDILDLLEYTLTEDGYDVICCSDTKNVKNLLDEEHISLILMDRNLPTMDGSLFVKKLRENGYNNPVIYLTAKDSDEDILQGFKSGCDDYITKPFNLDILKARIRVIIDRDKEKLQVKKHKDIVYVAKNKKFFVNKKEINLTSLEHDLMLKFLQNIDILLSRELLIQSVWNNDDSIKSKTVNVAIKRLKEKIDSNNTKKYIKSIRGEGYIFCKN
jgi:DNA-binding response OmpR family regulator